MFFFLTLFKKIVWSQFRALKWKCFINTDLNDWRGTPRVLKIVTCHILIVVQMRWRPIRTLFEYQSCPSLMSLPYARAEAGWYVMTLCACVKGGACAGGGEGAFSCSARVLPPRVQRVLAPDSTSTVSSWPVILPRKTFSLSHITLNTNNYKRHC